MCPLHSVHCDERSTGHVPFRRRCDTLRWTLLACRYLPRSDTTVIRDMVSLLDCRSFVLVVGVIVGVLV